MHIILMIRALMDTSESRIVAPGSRWIRSTKISSLSPSISATRHVGGRGSDREIVLCAVSRDVFRCSSGDKNMKYIGWYPHDAIGRGISRYGQPSCFIYLCREDGITFSWTRATLTRNDRSWENGNDANVEPEVDLALWATLTERSIIGCRNRRHMLGCKQNPEWCLATADPFLIAVFYAMCWGRGLHLKLTLSCTCDRYVTWREVMLGTQILGY